MKSKILLELFYNLKKSPRLMRKFKIFVGLSLVGVLFVGSIGVYFAFAGVKYLAGLGSSEKIFQAAEVVSQKAQDLTKPLSETLVPSSTCLETGLGLLDLQKLISTPLKDSVQLLKQSCFQPVMDSIKPPTEKT